MRKYILFASMLLAGCTTSPQDCDLHAQDPSFITKLSCATSGSYRQNIDTQEQQVLQSQRNQKIATQDLANIQSREQASSQKLENEQAQLTALRTDLDKMISRLQSSKVKNKQSQQEIKKLKDLQQQSQKASSISEITAIQSKIAEAKKRIDALEQANAFN
ncbi:hypothetical protein [Klebsiella sp. BIGb0407]|uniref:hypothetical protein n=1 Tax=Klebsiella sp. BIGb0407 TaxID=2940603 RepID=UPI002168C323|nr:hypothetical protein [Klebsiella sp. BIGb0407]MCS3431087.1 chromosome segregation ATPase [Klebsiella sp. BIGb0407]